MWKQITFLLFFIGFSVNLDAQINPVRLAQSRMKKGKWVQAEVQLKKSLRKDSFNPEAKYVYTLWYFSPQNHRFNIDSSYQYVLRTLEAYHHLPQREREKLQRFPLDSGLIIRLREQIDSAGFERAKAVNTEISYITFLDQFTFASHRNAAIELRDEVAYLDALKMNTYQSFKTYATRYPQSHRTEEAEKRYEKLLFEEKTKDGKLISFKEFLKEYPDTPYKDVVEQEIFEISTASGKAKDYINFIKSYNSSHTANKARDILYHIVNRTGELFPAELLTDSLKRVRKLEFGYWIPIYRGGLFGFIDERGAEVMSLRFENIDSDYLCGEIDSDYLTTSEGIVSRGGELIVKGKVDSAEDLGFGFLLIKSKNCVSLIHKSGIKLVQPCIEDATIIAGHFLAVKVKSVWALYAFNGREILPARYSQIRSYDELIVLTHTGKKIIFSLNEIIKAADGEKLTEDLVFDDIRPIGEKQFLVKNGALEGILNENLTFDLPLDRQALTKTDFGFVRKRYQNYSIIGLSSSLEKEQYDQILPYGNWIGLRKSDRYRVFRQDTKKFTSIDADTVWLENRIVFASSKDSLHACLQSGKTLSFSKEASVHFMKSADSTQFFYSLDKNKKWVYELISGRRLFSGEFDEIEYLTNNTFLISKARKKGLVNFEGKIILPMEYEAIILTGKGFASILKDRKFGLYDLLNRHIIQPEYERNVLLIDNRWLVGYKNGYGFIAMNAEPLSPFDFEEIRPWNDSCALVKKNFQWLIYDVKNRKVRGEGIKNYSFVKDTPDETIAIVNQGNYYGVISNRKGIILASTFDDIINLGSMERPLYFAEKYVEEAGIHVVLYYDQNGQLLRRQVYDTKEYDRVYCDSK